MENPVVHQSAKSFLPPAVMAVVNVIGLILFLYGMQDLQKYSYMWVPPFWSFLSLVGFAYTRSSGFRALMVLSVIAAILNFPFYIGNMGFVRQADLCKSSKQNCYGALLHDSVDASVAYAGAGIQIFSLLVGLIVCLEDLRFGSRTPTVSSMWFWTFLFFCCLNAIGFVVGLIGIVTPDASYLAGVMSTEVAPPFWGLVSGFSLTFGAILQSRDLLVVSPVAAVYCIMQYLYSYETLRYLRDDKFITGSEADSALKLYLAGLIMQICSMLPFMMLAALQIASVESITREIPFSEVVDKNDDVALAESVSPNSAMPLAPGDVHFAVPVDQSYAVNEPAAARTTTVAENTDDSVESPAVDVVPI
eukprot:ANDGO_03825.mRNA.1 hypothetical protein